MTNDTTALVRKMREALIAVESSVDIGLQRRKAIFAADQWLAKNDYPPPTWKEVWKLRDEVEKLTKECCALRAEQRRNWTRTCERAYAKACDIKLEE